MHLNLVFKLLVVGAVCAAIASCSNNNEDTRGASPSQSTATGAAALQAQAASCFQDHGDVLGQVKTMVDQYSSGCATDQDCTVIDPSVSCQGNCRTAIHRQNAGAFQASLGALEARVCPTLNPSCHMNFFCATSSGAKCIGGICVAMFLGLAPEDAGVGGLDSAMVGPGSNDAAQP